MARLVSLIVAVVASLAGGLLVLSQGGVLFRLGARGSGRVDQVEIAVIIAASLVVLGALLHLVATLTAGWSSLGVIVVGAVQTLGGLAAFAVPPYFGTPFRGGGVMNPVYDGVRGVYGVLPDVGNGLYLFLPTGSLLALGVLNLVLGLVAARRRRGTIASPATARFVALILGLLVAVPAVGMIAVGGYTNYSSAFTQLRGQSLTGVGLTLGGIVLLLVLVLAVRWSSVAAILGGSIVTLLAGFLLFAPRLVLNPVWDALPRDVVVATQVATWSGWTITLGLALLGAGIAGRIAGRVAARRSNWVAPHPGAEGDEPARPWVTPGYTPVDGGGGAAVVDRTSPTVVLPGDPPATPGYPEPGSR